MKSPLRFTSPIQQLKLVQPAFNSYQKVCVTTDFDMHISTCVIETLLCASGSVVLTVVEETHRLGRIVRVAKDVRRSKFQSNAFGKGDAHGRIELLEDLESESQSEPSDKQEKLKALPYNYRDVKDISTPPRQGDHVRFRISSSKDRSRMRCVEVEVVDPPAETVLTERPAFRKPVRPKIYEPARQPKLPDGGKGFTLVRTISVPKF
jgi:hypothetical protein